MKKFIIIYAICVLYPFMQDLQFIFEIICLTPSFPSQIIYF